VLRLAQGAREAVARLQRLFFLNEGQSLSQVGHRGKPVELTDRWRLARGAAAGLHAWLLPLV
jgi:hypothetical protein